MKVGVRKPSIKKSISARTTGKLTRSVKKVTSPGYGRKGAGLIKNPSKSLYNYTYKRMTTSAIPSSFGLSKKSYKPKSSSYKSSTHKSNYSYKSSSYKSSNTKRTYKYTKPNYSTNLKYNSAGSSFTSISDSNESIWDEIRSDTNNMVFNNVTKSYNLNYNKVQDKDFKPFSLSIDDYLIDKKVESIYDDSDNNDDTNSLYIGRNEAKLELVKIKHDIFDTKFINPVYDSYTRYERLDGFSHCIHMYDKYYGGHGLLDLFCLISTNDEINIQSYLYISKSKIYINCCYADGDTIQKRELGYIDTPVIYNELKLCSDIKVNLRNILSNSFNVDIYIKDSDFEKILDLRNKEEIKKNKLENIYNIITEKSDVAYQFEVLGVECENNQYVDDAILNYKKSIELGYATYYSLERLFLLYGYKNDIKSQIKVAKKAIKNLEAVSNNELLAGLDSKINNFKTALEYLKEKEYDLSKKDLNSIIEENNKDKDSTDEKLDVKKKNYFSTLFNIFKFTKKEIPEISLNTIDKDSLSNKDSLKISDDGEIENNKLIPPLKLIYDKVYENKIYTFEPVGYKYFKTVDGLYSGINIFREFDSLNPKDVNPNYRLISKIKLALEYNKLIHLDFRVENKDDFLLVHATFIRDNKTYEGIVGYISNTGLVKELSTCEDIKIMLNRRSFPLIDADIFIKKKDLKRILKNR